MRHSANGPTLWIHCRICAGGTGLAFTLGGGNETVTAAISALAEPLVGLDIETIMADFRRHWHALANHPTWRWLGPEKGNVHLALAAITNACFDLWAKARGLPLWKLLLSLNPRQVRHLPSPCYCCESFNSHVCYLALLRWWPCVISLLSTTY